MSFNTSFLVGTTLGRDHLFWPTRSQAQTDTIIAGGTFYPNFSSPVCSLEQIIVIAARVKEWRFSGSWSGTAVVGAGTGTATCTIENSPTPNKAVVKTAYPVFAGESALNDVAQEPLLASEFLAPSHGIPGQYTTDLIYLRRNYGFLSPLRQIDALHGPFGFLRMNRVGTIPPGVDTGAFVFLFGDGGKPLVVVDGFLAGLFGDSRGLDITVFESNMFSPVFIFVDVAFIGNTLICRTSFRSESPNAVFTIDPLVTDPFTAPMRILSDGTLLSSSCSLTMTAHKFFEYSNSLGQAIYDADSGEPTGADPFA